MAYGRLPLYQLQMVGTGYFYGIIHSTNGITSITRAGHNCMMNPKFWVTIFSDKAEGQAVKALGPTKLWIDCWIGSVSEPLGDAFFAAKTWQFYR